MERVRPLVCILTDGSGSGGAARTGFSVAVIEGCGAAVGPVMGEMPDRAWYAAVLAGDAAPFVAAAERIAGAAGAGALVVSDPVEGYNPMHDLACALADRVASAVGGGRRVYPLMGPAAGEVVALDAAARARKLAAIAGYTPLAGEAAALMEADPGAVAAERLVELGDDWPERPVRAPGYEAVGAGRLAAGVYAETITYAAHVRPLAVALRGAGAGGSVLRFGAVPQ